MIKSSKTHHLKMRGSFEENIEAGVLTLTVARKKFYVKIFNISVMVGSYGHD